MTDSELLDLVDFARLRDADFRRLGLLLLDQDGRSYSGSDQACTLDCECDYNCACELGAAL